MSLPQPPPPNRSQSLAVTLIRPTTNLPWPQAQARLYSLVPVLTSNLTQLTPTPGHTRLHLKPNSDLNPESNSNPQTHFRPLTPRPNLTQT